MRSLNFPLNIHKDHISAVIDVDYSPTGKEIASASYDKTLRIFEVPCRSTDLFHRVRPRRNVKD